MALSTAMTPGGSTAKLTESATGPPSLEYSTFARSS